MDRYTKVKEHLSKKLESELRICDKNICACKGCAGEVNGVKIKPHELERFFEERRRN